MLEPEDRDPSVVTTIDETNPLRRVFGEDERFVSSGDDPYSGVGLAPGGMSAGLPDLPFEITAQGDSVFTYQYGDEEVIISIGGEAPNEGIPVIIYSASMGMTDDAGIFDPVADGAADLTDSNELTLGHANVVGDYFVVAGGDLAGSVTNRIFVLDTTADNPAWSELNSTLTQSVEGGGACVYDGYLYIFGGDAGNFSPQNTVQRIDPVNDTVESVGTLPDTIRGVKAVRIGTRVYIMGGVSSGGGTLPIGTLIYYDLDTDTGGTLARLTESGDEDGPEPKTPHEGGAMFEFEGNIFYLDGDSDFTTKDIAIYSPEEDKWAYRSFDSSIETVGGEQPSANMWYGIKSGAVVNDVAYIMGTEEKPGIIAAYTPERNPPEFE